MFLVQLKTYIVISKKSQKFTIEKNRRSRKLDFHFSQKENLKKFKNQSFKKLRHGFVDKSTMITATLITSSHWKTLAPFCLRNKRPENTFLILTVIYHKIMRKNTLCHLKQQ